MQHRRISPQKLYLKLSLLFLNCGVIGALLFFAWPQDLDRISRSATFGSLGMPDVAVRELLRVQKKWAAPEPIRYKLAKIFYRGTDYGQAEWLFRSVLGKDPVRDDEIRYYLWRIYQKRKRYDDADAIIAPLLKDPKAARAWELVGNVRLLQKDRSAALLAYEKAHQLNPKEPRYLLKIGSSYAQLDRPLEARASFEEGLSLDPGNGSLYSHLIRLLDKEGEGAAYLKRLLEIYPKDPLLDNAYIRLGEFYRSRGFYRKAIRHYQGFLLLYPRAPQAYFFLGLSYLESGQARKARECFSKVLDIVPGFLPAQYYSGLASLRLGELDLARESLRSVRAKGYKEVPDDLIRDLERTLHIYA